MSAKIIKESVNRGDFEDTGIKLNMQEALDKELALSEKTKIKAENLGILIFIVNGTLADDLTIHYESLAKVLDDVHLKYADEIKNLEKKYGKNTQKYLKNKN